MDEVNEVSGAAPELPEPKEAGEQKPIRFRLRPVHAAGVIIGLGVGFLFILMLLSYFHLDDFYKASFLTIQNTPVSLADFPDRMILVILFETTNEITSDLLRDYSYFESNIYYQSKVKVVGIAIDIPPRRALQQFIQTSGVHYTILTPSKNALKTIPSFTAYPAVVILNKQGRILVQHDGLPAIQQLAAECDAIAKLEE